MSLGHLILLSLALGIGAWLFFLWSVKSGQYDDPEGPKYRMLEDEDGRAAPPGGRPAEPGRGPTEEGESGAAELPALSRRDRVADPRRRH
ncbi:MAG TPA: cbb3-type cytochrome oxidase assembly protein CcoS [Anaeromyxobacteraceae bacterium]|nr:cbb3-type cytochrome oxidase assembly protein CcoS [Anaeromyxobacteraceae bacterium]